MVDVDPSATVSKYAPRESTIVDAVAASRRVSDQILRSNPLKNAQVDGGLTRWVGNYGDNFVWFGEITPYDPNMTDGYGNVKMQRGIVFRRDDTQSNFAFHLYDSSPQAGVPLRQTFTWKDADDRTLWEESRHHGGQSFPLMNVPMYQRRIAWNNTGMNAVCVGRSSIVGRLVSYMFYIHTYAQWLVAGGPGAGDVDVILPFAGPQANLRVQWQLSIDAGPYTMTTPLTTQGPAGGYVQGVLDISDAFDAGESFMYLNLNARISAGDTSDNAYGIAPVYVHNYSENG